MDIRTKLIFALVVVSLASMFALGAVMAPRVTGFLTVDTFERLDELAASESQALRFIIDGWHDRTDLIASRTLLRASVEEFERTGSAAARARIQTILSDAIGASRSTTFVGVQDREGNPVASVARGAGTVSPSRAVPPLPRPPERTAYAGVQFDGTGPPHVTFAAPLEWDGRLIGSLVAVFEAREVQDLTGSDGALGESGETLVFAEDADGALRTLHPTRHRREAAGGVVLSAEPGGLAARALGGDTQVGLAVRADAGAEPADERVTDYRGEVVWAATRLVPETGWGLAVKVDAREEERRHAEFRAWLRQTALILSAFAILAGFVLGLRFALPIHALSEAADRIRAGDMRARAKVIAEDEVGLLARTFNEMADELEDRVGILHQFRKFFDVSIDLMCIAGTDGYFKRTNPAFERVLGWSQEELCARPFFDFVHADDVLKTEQEVAKLAEGIPTISFENRFLCRDGSYRVLRWTSYPEKGVLYAIAHLIDEAPLA